MSLWLVRAGAHGEQEQEQGALGNSVVTIGQIVESHCVTMCNARHVVG